MKKINMLILMLAVTVILTGCNNNDTNKNLKEKTVTELEYINTKTLDILNNLNNISLKNYQVISEKISLSEETQSEESGSGNQSSSGNKSDSSQDEGSSDTNKNEITSMQMVPDTILSNSRNDIDWQTIKTDIELINTSWSVIALDLYSQNVPNDIIRNFETTLNACIISIKVEDKEKSLTNLANLYSFTPEFLKIINQDKNSQSIKQTESYIINAYSLVGENLSNIGIQENVKKAKDEFASVLSDEEYTKNKAYKINKIYVLIDELQNSLTTNDSDVFYLKYKLLMEAINSL